MLKTQVEWLPLEQFLGRLAELSISDEEYQLAAVTPPENISASVDEIAAAVAAFRKDIQSTLADEVPDFVAPERRE